MIEARSAVPTARNSWTRDLRLYQELLARERQRLPNRYWAGTVGRVRAILLLRYVLQERLVWTRSQIAQQFKRDILRRFKLDSACQIHFGSSMVRYLLAASPRLDAHDLRYARDRYEKKAIHVFRRIDSERPAYFLGLLMADGNVSRGRVLSIALKARDSEILTQLRHLLGADSLPLASLKDGTRRLSVHSTALVKDLARHGLGPRKAKRLRFPTTVPTPLLPHFLRGFLDGDGSVQPRRWFLTCASRPFAVALQRRLQRLTPAPLCLNVVGPKIHGRPRRCWQVSGGQHTRAVLDWVYRDVHIALVRKQRAYLDWWRDAIPPLVPSRIMVRRPGWRKGERITVTCSTPSCQRAFGLSGNRDRGGRWRFCAACRARYPYRRWMANQGWGAVPLARAA